MWLKSFGQSIKQVSSLSWSSQFTDYVLVQSRPQLRHSSIILVVSTICTSTTHVDLNPHFYQWLIHVHELREKRPLLNHLQYSLKNDCFHSNVIIPPDVTLCLSRRYLHTHKHTYTAIRIPLFFDLSLTLSLSLFSCTQTLISFSNYTPW